MFIKERERIFLALRATTKLRIFIPYLRFYVTYHVVIYLQYHEHLSTFLFLGISLKTQELYALVFLARYLDIVTNFISLYNTIMKLIFLGSSFMIVWYIRRHRIVRRSYDKEHDTFRHLFLVLPCFILALLINERSAFKEVIY